MKHAWQGTNPGNIWRAPTLVIWKVNDSQSVSQSYTRGELTGKENCLVRAF